MFLIQTVWYFYKVAILGTAIFTHIINAIITKNAKHIFFPIVH